LILDDPLTNGATIGIRDNGQGVFVPGEGWKVTSYSDNIRYTPALPVEDGAVEFNVKGLTVSDDVNPDGQLMSMYDASWGDPRHVYSPDLRLNPFKMVWHRYGDDGAQYHEDEFKFILKCDDVLQYEDYSSIGAYPWSPTATYHMRVRWKDGVFRYFLNGAETDRWPWFYKGIYDPATHDIRIGTNTRNNAIIDAIYSNVKIYDYQTVPVAPYIGNPSADRVCTTLTPIVDWVGERHDAYEVHVTSGPDPSAGIVHNSGQVSSTNHYHRVTSGLSSGSVYHAHVRLRNSRGWGPWSDPRPFQIETGGTVHVPRYSEYEIVLLANADYTNPYLDVTLSATFTGPGTTITMDGFWDGARLYKIRMLPTAPGTWSWTTSSNQASLNAISGSFVGDASGNKGYVRVSSASPYTYEWAGDGSPFFLMGDTIWHMWYNIRYSDGSFQKLIDDRAAQHFNYAHGVVDDWPHNEGGNIFRLQDAVTELYNCDTLNPAYFHWLDKKVEYMNARGMAASLFFSWGNEGYQDFTSAAQYMAYERYLVARYASRNVFWIVVGEFEEAGEPDSRWIDYMNEIYNHDPYHHPISLHTVQTTDRFGGQTAHSFVSQQRKGTPSELRQLIANSRIYNKPVVNLEYGYEGNPITFPANQPANDVRKDHYAIVLAGGFGVYGNNVPQYSTYHVTRDFVLTATDTPGAGYMKILFEFFANTSFHRLEPAQGLVTAGICAAWPDNEYVVQLVSGGSVNLNLTAASGTFFVDWYNPRTGDRNPAGTTTGGATRSFTAPDGNDWILHIHKQAINEGAPVPAIDATPTSGLPPLEVNFDATGSYDTDGTIVAYAWDFDGDGNTDSTSITDTHTYSAVGTYTARLTVTDNDDKIGATSVEIDVGIPGVSIDLGQLNVEAGLTHYSSGDGDTVFTTVGGRECRRNVDPALDHYFMFGVDDGYAFEGSSPDQYITIEYYDAGAGTLELQYDSPGDTLADRYKPGGSVALTGTDTWKTYAFHVTDAWFGNRQNAGADFRIYGSDSITFYLDIVRVSEVPVLWTPTAVIAAIPAAGQVPLEVSFDGSGSSDPDGTIVSYAWDFDGDGDTDSTQSTDTFTYTLADAYLARLTVTDIDGLTDSTTVTISAVSLYLGDFAPKDGDSDQADFGHLQSCLTAAGTLPEPECEDADLDGDGKIDANDIALFMNCMGGAGAPPDC
jgi:PKD repeat protein